MVLSIALVTLGDPDTLTGGYLFHKRVAELAPRFDATIRFVSFPEWRFPLPVMAGPALLRGLRGADAVVLDSIAAAFMTPWMPFVRVPVVGMLHQPPGGIDHGGLRRTVQRGLDTWTWRQCRRLLVASHALAEEMARQGFPDTQVVCPGADVAEASTAVEGDLRQGRRAAILAVGNWVARKDLLTLIDAFAMLDDNAATLHLVGDEEAEPAYGARVKRRLALGDVRDRVVRHGRRSRAEVAGLYEAADMFALASLKEPYGTVYGEAMAWGLPVVGWRAGNLPHLATHGREGFTPPPGDVRGLTQALRRLCDDPALRTTMGEAAREKARSFPSWEKTTSDLIDAVRRTTT